MKNLQPLNRAEMKNVLGGFVQPITCSLTVNGDEGFSESGACASSNMDDCFAYIGNKASTYNANLGYPGVNYECHYA